MVELEVDSNQLVLHGIGIDTKTTLNDNIELLQQHCGEGRLFPGLPNCKFKGIKIPGYLTFTESGGITAEILTNIFVGKWTIYHYSIMIVMLEWFPTSA